MPNAAMKTTLTPIRQPNEVTRGQCYLPRVTPPVTEDRGPLLGLVPELRSRGFRRGQSKNDAADHHDDDDRHQKSGCDTKKPPVSFDGEPSDTDRGRTDRERPMTISTPQR